MLSRRRLNDPEFSEPTMGKRPETPFPGVAPVPTMRRQGDSSYDHGIDMCDGRGPAEPWCTMDIGAGGKLGVDPGYHTSGDAGASPLDSTFWGIPEPIKRRKR